MNLPIETNAVEEEWAMFKVSILQASKEMCGRTKYEGTEMKKTNGGMMR